MFSGSHLKKIIPLILVLCLFGYGAYALKRVGDNQSYAPTQPIPFSHKLHAGQNSIPCMYCHVGVETSKHATVPSANVCMNCHSVVKTDSPYIKQVREAFQNNKPIEWVKVHDLPDFVNFTHKRHVAKGISCETCHGDVKNKEKINQEKPLTMGWCLDCHRGNTAPAFLYEDKNHQSGVAAEDGGLGHARAAVALTKGVDPSALPRTDNRLGTPVAPISCYTCHH